MKRTFTARIGGDEGPDSGEVPYIEVPAAVVDALGRARRPKVVVALGRSSYRSTVAVYGGRYYLPLNRQNLVLTGVSLGQQVEVSLELDTAPREVELPPALAAALDADPVAKEVFEKRSYSTRREHAEAVAGAKREATRERRIQSIMRSLEPESDSPSSASSRS